jgi:hypothetical protein
MRCRQSCKKPIEFVAEIYKKKKQTNIEQQLDTARDTRFRVTAKIADECVPYATLPAIKPSPPSELLPMNMPLTDIILCDRWELCERALRIEKSIQQLIIVHQRGEADASRGAALFYTLMEMIGGSASQFPPARATVDCVGTMLAKAFVADDPNVRINSLPMGTTGSSTVSLIHSYSIQQTGRFLYALLQDEHKANHYSPLFKPVLSPDTFAAMYRVILDKVGYLDVDVIANLLRRFDIVAWLNGASKKEEQQDLLKIIGTHLTKPLAASPSQPIGMKDIPSTWAEALPHFGIVASHQFPVHLNCSYFILLTLCLLGDT